MEIILDKNPTRGLKILAMMAELDDHLQGADFVKDDVLVDNVYGVYMDSSLIGLVKVNPKNYFGKQYRYIEGIYVRQSHQGRGIGPVIITTAIGKKRGIAWIADNNTHSRKAFLEVGFTEDKAKTSSDGVQGHWFITK